MFACGPPTRFASSGARAASERHPRPVWCVARTARPACDLRAAAAIAGNSAIGAVLGWLHAAYGFEYAMLCHAIAHLIVVLAG